jgi:hypothetical protein
MALTLNNFTGFETQGAEEASATAGTLTYETTNPRNGDAALIIDSGADEFDLPWVEGVTDAGSAYVFGVAMQSPSGHGATTVLEVMDDSSTTIMVLRWVNDNTMILRDANDSALDTSAVLSTGEWHFFEVYAQLNNGSANWEWFIDGTSEGSGSGADLTNGNGFGSASSFLRFGSTTSTIWFDDVYILSGATAASDRYGDFAVTMYQQTEMGATDNGDGLTNGTWTLVGQTPAVTDTSNDAEYDGTGSAWAGDTTTDAGASPDNARSGPSGDGDVSDTASVAAKFVWTLQRSNGKAHTSMFGRYGNDVDGTADTADLPLATAYSNEFFLSESAAVVPTNTENFRIGFGATGDGARTITCGEQWAMLGFVPLKTSETLSALSSGILGIQNSFAGPFEI